MMNQCSIMWENSSLFLPRSLLVVANFTQNSPKVEYKYFYILVNILLNTYLASEVALKNSYKANTLH